MRRTTKTRRLTSRLFYRDLAVILATITLAVAFIADDSGLADRLCLLALLALLTSSLLHLWAKLRP
jgi:hypothetical protein